MEMFRGTGVALVTPMKNGAVDFTSLEKVIEHCIKGGVDFLVVLGTTGETPTLKLEEKIAILNFVEEKNRGRLPLVAGMFGENSTERVVQLLNKIDLSGYQAVMAASPAYNKPPQEGIFQHFMAIEAASPLPIIIYNVPGRTASNVEADTILRLAHTSKKFIAVKEASADLVQCSEIIRKRPDGFLVLSGDDPTALPLLACGGDGNISVIGNALPQLWSEMVAAALQGDFQSARTIHLQLLDIHHWLYIDGNPAGIKAALEILGIGKKEVRLPLVSLSKVPYSALKRALTDIVELTEIVLDY